MQLIQIKPSSPATTSKKRKPANLLEQFERHWRLVEKSRQDNGKLTEDIARLRQRYEAEVLPVEMRMNDLIAQECFRLMDFFEHKGLSEQEKVALVDWLAANVESLQSHPCYPAADKARVSSAFFELLQSTLDKQTAREAKKSSRANKNKHAPNQQNLFGEEGLEEIGGSARDQSEQKNAAPEDFDELFRQLFSEDEWQQFSDECDQSGEQPAPDFSKAGDLVRPDSINAMFRRLARVLHPDKELDASRKREKHLLMSRLLKARDTNDLPALLAMHREFVADEPLAIEQHELKTLIAMLKRQLQQLAHDKQQIIHQDPVSTVVYFWYHDKTEKQIAAKVNKHLRELKASIHECRYFLDEVTTVGKLKRFLRFN